MAEKDLQKVIDSAEDKIKAGSYFAGTSVFAIGLEAFTIIYSNEPSHVDAHIYGFLSGMLALGSSILIYYGIKEIVTGHAELQAATTAQLLRDSLPQTSED